MRLLIGNEVNTKSIISNILNKSCPNVIILHGDFGTGKTEFAIDIARTIVCTAVTEKGYCGECPACRDSQTISKDTFLSRISLTNMTLVDKEKVISLLRENTAMKFFGNRVFIYDEFHAVSKNLQEMWLSETRNLEGVYLILTTTRVRDIDDGIVSRAIPMKMRPLTRASIPRLLKMYNLDDTEPEVIEQLYATFLGLPRPIINNALYCRNSNLTLDEKLEFISSHRKLNIGDILTSIDNRQIYFSLLNDVKNTYSVEEIKVSGDTYLWSVLTLDDGAYADHELAQFYKKEELVKLLVDIRVDPINALLRFYTQKKVHRLGLDKEQVNSAIDKALAKDKKVGQTYGDRKELEKW